MEDRESGTEVNSGCVWIGDNWIGCKYFIYLHFMFESKSREAYVGLFIWPHFLSPKKSKSKSTQNRLVQKKYSSQFNNLKETKCVSFNGGSKCIDGIV